MTAFNSYAATMNQRSDNRTAMTFLNRPLAALAAWFARRTAFLALPQAPRVAALCVPLLFGLVSMALGQDSNWDWRNYHLYNGYAVLNGRIGFDLAPAAFQSYFNPALDVFYRLLFGALPPRAAGFVMGALHGLNFIVLAALARCLLGAGQQRLALLLAGAGMLGSGFLSTLGNSMGDNLTAVPLLGGLYLVLRRWQALGRPGASGLLTVLGAGLLCGAACGLKLTNAVYAVALCVALLTVPLAWWSRLRLAFVFGVGVLGGIAATAGWWFWTMWQTFGNPLFPQFNNIFHSPLTIESGVLDPFFRPRTLLENVLWPFISAFNTRRVSELPLKLMIWPALYLLLGALLITWLMRRRQGRVGAATVGAAAVTADSAGAGVAALPSAPDRRGVFALVFFFVGYVAWMRMFSIYRYLIVLELLAPLVFWLLWRQVAPAAPRVGGLLLALLTASVFPANTWGHSGWAERAYGAEVPPLAAPADAIVFLAHWDPPTAWVTPFLPPQARVVSLGTGFPESAGWRARIAAAVAERPGPHYLLLNAANNEKDGTRRRKLAAAEWLGLTQDAAGCGKLAWVMQRVRFQVALRQLPAGGCTFDLLPQHRIDLPAKNAAMIAEAATHVTRYGLRLEPDRCRPFQAFIGSEGFPFQLCRVAPTAP
jgi:hypothetical protein